MVNHSNGKVNSHSTISILDTLLAQILAYFPQVYLQKLRGSFFVATQSGALRHWPLRQRAELYFYWYVFLPSLTFMYPREVPLFGVDNRIITDWYSAGRCHEKYLFEYYNIGDAKVNSQHVSWTLKDKPVTVYNVENDHFAPYDATMWLTRTFTEPTFVSDLKMEYFNEKSKTLQILDLNFDSSDRKLESFGGNQKRDFIVFVGKLPRILDILTFLGKRKERMNVGLIY